jgi:ADP-ribose pyrophosphatase YjhB (NUDIX family)
MSQRKNPKKPMYLKYQVPCGKVDPGENSLQAAWRETKEETDLAIPAQRFQFLGNDENFNCDMYAVHLLPHEVPQRTEPQNMTVWMYYPWTVWYRMAEQGRTTPSLTTFRDLIWESTH